MKLFSLSRLTAVLFSGMVAFACLSPLSAAAPDARKSALPVVSVPDSELETLLTEAEAGKASAQIRLGHYYMGHYEEGFANETKAGEWFLKAAEAGNAEAQAWYAIYLFVTHPTPKEGEKLAYDWAYKSAEQEHPIGLYLMGIMTPRTDVEERQRWLKPAAKKGFVPAMRALASTMLCHEHPMEDKKDPVVKAAFKLLDKATRRQDCESLMVASGSLGRRESSGIQQKTLVHPLKESEKYGKAALAAALQREWQWYDTVFDFEFLVRRYVAGGARYYQLIRAYLNLRSLYEFKHEDKKAEKIPVQLVAHLKKLAKEDPVCANYALAHLLMNWKGLYMGPDVPMPDEDYKEYAQKAAAATPQNYCDHAIIRSAAGM